MALDLPEHSTTTALNLVNNNVQKCLNQKKPGNRALLVALDLTSALDTIDHNLPLGGILELLKNAKRWFASNLPGRFYVEYNNKHQSGEVKQGVPQGGVLSPMLFNIYMSKLPLLPKDINITSYADYLTVTTSHPQVEKLRDFITSYLNTLRDWLESRKLKLPAKKSSATVFKT